MPWALPPQRWDTDCRSTPRTDAYSRPSNCWGYLNHDANRLGIDPPEQEGPMNIRSISGGGGTSPGSSRCFITHRSGPNSLTGATCSARSTLCVGQDAEVAQLDESAEVGARRICSKVRRPSESQDGRTTACGSRYAATLPPGLCSRRVRGAPSPPPGRGPGPSPEPGTRLGRRRPSRSTTEMPVSGPRTSRLGNQPFMVRLKPHVSDRSSRSRWA